MKYQQLRKKTEGFTIIEVLIVLAIAGLILLIVFLAVPQIRRNQANTAVRAEASRILAGVVEFESNSNGNQISSDTEYQQVVKGVNRKELTAALINHHYATSNGAANVMDTASRQTRLIKGTCSGTAAVYNAGARTYALQYWLDGNTTGCSQS